MFERQRNNRTTGPDGRRRVPRPRLRLWPILLACAALLLAVPRPAHAWIGWLDRLSGPGPWRGVDVDIRIACFVDVTTLDEAARASQTAFSFISQQANARDSLQTHRTDGRLKVLGTKTVGDFKTLDFWTGKIATRNEAPPSGVAPPVSMQSMMIALGDDLDFLAEDFEKALPATAEQLKPTYSEIVRELKRAGSFWRSATQPRISTGPGFVADSSCSDHLLLNKEQARIRRGDRKPSPSFILNIRQLYANHDAPFAKGQQITLTAVEPKLSWPLSGRFDFLEGQVGAGRYWMSSEGFPSGSTQQGWIVEPIRFDLHVPSKFADGRWRFLTIVSYSAGVVMFPQGFPVNAFYDGSTPIGGGEAIFEQSFVINLSRLLK